MSCQEVWRVKTSPPSWILSLEHELSPASGAFASGLG